MAFQCRQDVVVWMLSVFFVVSFLAGVWGWGNAKGWNVSVGYKYGENNSERIRFLPEPVDCNDSTVPGRSGVDCTAHWYFWKLPPQDATTLTRAIVWIFYACHQLLIWGLLYRAQVIVSSNLKEKKYRTDLRWFNWAMLSVNVLFHAIHLVHTHWTYDGLAQDVDIFSSLGAVVMMSTFIIVIEYKDRGMILMWPNPNSSDKVANRLRLSQEPIRLLRKYHGYAFSWAVIYTFWYHPMENTLGHLLGFFHTAIVMLQGSLIYTQIHLNKYWRLLNESWVLIHGTAVAVQMSQSVKESNEWPRIAFGFGFLFAFTQIFGLPFWKQISLRFRGIPPTLYIVSVLSLCYTHMRDHSDPTIPGFNRLYHLFFVPTMLYIGALIGWSDILLCQKLDERCTRKSTHNLPHKLRQPVFLCIIFTVYTMFIILGYFTKHVSVSSLFLLIAYSLFFTICVGFTLVLFKKLFASISNVGPTDTNGNEIKQNDLVGTVNHRFVYER